MVKLTQVGNKAIRLDVLFGVVQNGCSPDFGLKKGCFSGYFFYVEPPVDLFNIVLQGNFTGQFFSQV